MLGDDTSLRDCLHFLLLEAEVNADPGFGKSIAKKSAVGICSIQPREVDPGLKGSHVPGNIGSSSRIAGLSLHFDDGHGSLR